MNTLSFAARISRRASYAGKIQNFFLKSLLWGSPLFIVLSSYWPHAAFAENVRSECEAVLAAADVIASYKEAHPSHKLGFQTRPIAVNEELKLMTEHATSDFRSQIESASFIHLTGAYIFDGEREVGHMTYFASEIEAYIDYMLVAPEERGRGVSGVLTGLFLKGRDALERINSNLDEDNLAAYDAALARGVSPEDAVRGTPFYKVLAEFGFCRVVVATEIPGGHGMARMIRVALER